MKIVTVAIGIVVVVVLMGGVLMPALSLADDAVTTEYNQPTNSQKMLLDETAAFNGSMVYSNGTLTIGDNTYAHPTSYTAIMILSDQFVFYTAADGNGFVNYYKSDTQKAAGFYTQNDITFTIADKAVTITSTDSSNNAISISETISWIAYRDDSGGHAASFFATNTNNTLYFEDIDQIRSANSISTTGDWFSMVGDDVKLNNTTDVELDNTSTADSNGVYGATISRTAGTISFDVDNSGVDYTVHPWVWLVPADFSVENSGMRGTLSIMSAIPLVVIAAVLIGVMALVFRSRMG